MKLTRSQPIHFTREDGTLIAAPAATRGQMRDVFLLDRESDNPLPGAEKRGRMVAIFLTNARWLQADGRTLAGETADLLDALTPEEEIDIINAFTAQHHGMEPTTAVEIQQALREHLKKKLLTPGLKT